MRKNRILAGLIILLAAGAGVNVTEVARRNWALLRNAASAPAGLSIVVNEPANRLYLYRDGEKIRTYTVSIGRKGFETPPGEYRIDHVVWNPWWHPPDSKWARGEKPHPPGPDNPMGRAKLYFGNLLYIHGTPYERQLGDPASHGCVRMANSDVQELARIVHEYGSPATTGVIDGLLRNPQMTRTVWLKTKVPLSIQYNLVDVVDGKVEIYPDVYGRGKGDLRKKVGEVLAREGVEPSRIDHDNLNRLLERYDRRGVATAEPLESLIAGGTVAADAASD